MSGKHILGRVVPIYRGEYDPTEKYNTLDVVEFLGSSYVCLQDNTVTRQPDQHPDLWGLIARRGHDQMTHEKWEEAKQALLSELLNDPEMIEVRNGLYWHTFN